MVIDSHVHFPFSLPVPEEEWGKFLVERAARSGISALIVSDVFIRGRKDAGSYPSSAALRFANSYAAEQAAKNPGRLYFLAYLNPQNPDWEEELLHAAADGAVGVKLWVALKDANGSLENSIKVLKKAAAMGLPVLIHVFARAEANSPGEVDIAEFVELSRRVPECVLIGGHSGANFRESTGMFKCASENTYWDISGTNPDCSMVPEILKEVSPGKVLFGSDGPGRSFSAQVHKVTLAPISDEAKKQILCDNILKVYDLPGLYTASLVHSVSAAPVVDPSEDHFTFCGRWPFFEKAEITPGELENKLAAAGIEKAFTVSFNTMFRIDLLNANREFLKACENLKRLRPLAVVDPEARNIEVLLDDAAEKNFSGVWYSPALLGQTPDSPKALKLYGACLQRKLPVYLNCRLGEDRFRHRSLILRNLEFKDLAGFFKSAPPHDYIIQGMAPAPEIPREDCRFTFERLTDGEGGLANYLARGGRKEALLRGSEYPFRELEQTLLASENNPFTGSSCKNSQ